MLLRCTAGRDDHHALRFVDRFPLLSNARQNGLDLRFGLVAAYPGLVAILEGDPVHGGGWVDLSTGDVWPESAVEYAREVGEISEEEDDDPVRWLWWTQRGRNRAIATWTGSSRISTTLTSLAAGPGDRRARRPLASVQGTPVGASRAHHEVARLLRRSPTRAGRRRLAAERYTPVPRHD